MTDAELIAMARLAQRDDRMSTGALYGDLADRIEELDRACSEWADASQANYQRAKTAEAKLAKAVEALERVSNSQPRPKRNGDYDRSDVSALQRIARTAIAELTGSTTVKDYLTPEDEKQSHEWKCPIDYSGCRKNCGSYGCGN